MEVLLEQVSGVDWVVKSASSEEEEDRLAVEAAQLRRATHPGVVEVSAGQGADPSRLRTRYAGRCLTSLGPLPAAELCGLGAAVATVLADLHDLGIVHGAVTADHILVATDGRPVLCGFGRSGSSEDLEPATDVSGLAATLSDRLAADAPRRLVRALRAGTRGRRRIPSARMLAAELSRAMADRRLPSAIPGPEQGGDPTPGAPGARVAGWPDGPDPVVADRPVRADAATPAAHGRVAGGRVRVRGTGRPRRDRPGRAVTIAAAAATVAAVVAVVTSVLVGAVAARHGPAASAVCPATDRGCGPVPVRDGAFVTASGTYEVGIPDPIVVLGRWTCGSESLPAALDRRSGRVWTWSAWAGRRATVTATAVVTRPGARTLRVVPGGSGCDRLEVIAADGAATVVRPGLATGA